MNTIGKHITLTLFGESHGPAIGAVLDGFPCGQPVEEAAIARALSRRRPQGLTETQRVETDAFRILSGVFRGYTTGEPICVLIENTDTRSADYEHSRLARPSHADYVSHVAHRGFEDYRGGGHFSGRLTAPIVALGALCRQALQRKGILVGTHILSCGSVADRAFSDDESLLREELLRVAALDFPLLEPVREAMEAEIERVRLQSDSIGGVIQTAVLGLPVGVGDPWFDSLEGQLANAMFSIGGIKGVEFGLGFGFKDTTGRTANDEWYARDGRAMTYTNRNGGINGGLSNGMPVVFNCAVKPTPSIGAPQRSIDLNSLESGTLQVKGRHDPAIVRRVCSVVDALTSFVLCDALASAFSNRFFE